MPVRGRACELTLPATSTRAGAGCAAQGAQGGTAAGQAGQVGHAEAAAGWVLLPPFHAFRLLAAAAMLNMQKLLQDGCCCFPSPRPLFSGG